MYSAVECNPPTAHVPTNWFQVWEVTTLEKIVKTPSISCSLRSGFGFVRASEMLFPDHNFEFEEMFTNYPNSDNS